MTVQEAKGFIQGKLDCMNKCDVFECKGTDECENCNYCYSQGNFGEQKEAFKFAIECMKEVEQYRALEEKLNGISIEHIVNAFIERVEKDTNEGYEKGRILTNAEADMWEQYRALGTVEELKEAKKLLEKLEELKFANEQPKADWIPFEEKEADEDEREAYGCEYMLCCKLPDEDEEILVTYANGNVGEDIFLRDGYECYLDSGKEFITEAIAWMPKPQPYKKEGAE